MALGTSRRPWDEGASVIALDASPRSLEAAIQQPRTSGLTIDDRLGLAEAFRAGEESDAVMAVDVLEHAAGLDETLVRAVLHAGRQ